MKTRSFALVRRLALAAVTTALIGLVSACGADSTATTGTPATLSFTATAGAAALAATTTTPLAALGNGVVVDVFRFGVGEIELEQSAATDVDSEVEFEGQFIVDLLTGELTDVGNGNTTTTLLAVLPAGTYEELEFKLIPLAEVDATAPADLVALTIEGSYASILDGARTFAITVTVPFKIEVEGPDAIVLDGANNDLLLAFRLDAMLTPAVLDALLANGEITTATGTHYDVRVTSSTSTETQEAVAKLIHDALEFGEDHDGNHDLDEDEDVDDDTNGL